MFCAMLLSVEMRVCIWEGHLYKEILYVLLSVEVVVCVIHVAVPTEVSV